MVKRPFHDQNKRAFSDSSSNDLHRPDVNQDLLARIHSVKMGRIVIPPEHPNINPIESAKGRHQSSFGMIIPDS